MSIRQVSTYVVLGKKGSGKTVLVNRLLTSQKKIVVIDTLKYEYAGIICNSIQELFEALKEYKMKDDYRIVYRPFDDKVFEAFLLLRSMRDFCLVIEEANNYMTRNLNENLSWIVSNGRHIGCSMILVARIVTEIHPKIRNEITCLFSFHFEEPIYLKWLELYGFDRDKIKGLNKHQFLIVGEKPSILNTTKENTQ